MDAVANNYNLAVLSYNFTGTRTRLLNARRISCFCAFVGWMTPLSLSYLFVVACDASGALTILIEALPC